MLQYEKVNPETQKLFIFIKGTCTICGRNGSQIFTTQKTRGDYFIKEGKCKNNHCSVVSNIAWYDLNKNYILRLQDYCPNPKCNCQKTSYFYSKTLSNGRCWI